MSKTWVISKSKQSKKDVLQLAMVTHTQHTEREVQICVMPWPPCDSPLPVLQFCSAAAKHDHNMGLFASAAGALLLQPCMADPRSTSCSPAVSIWCYILYNWPQTSCKTILYKTLRGGNACHNNDDISQVMALNNCFSTLWSHLSTSYALSFFLVLFVGHVVHEEICSLCIKHIFLLSKAHSVLLYSFLFLLWNKHRHAHALDDASLWGHELTSTSSAFSQRAFLCCACIHAELLAKESGPMEDTEYNLKGESLSYCAPALMSNT